MTRYRTLALQVVYADVDDAETPEQADTLFRTYGPDNFTHEAWIGTLLLREKTPGSDEFVVVDEWTQPDLWLNAFNPTTTSPAPAPRVWVGVTDPTTDPTQSDKAP